MQNINDKNNYIVQMTEEEKITFLKILVTLAKSDGNFNDEEKAFVKETAIMFGLNKSHINEILAPTTVNELIQQSSKISNRQAALHLIKEACLLANSDGDLSKEEVFLIGQIGQAMNIELEKIEEISQWVIDRIVWLERGKIIFEQV